MEDGFKHDLKLKNYFLTHLIVCDRHFIAGIDRRIVKFKWIDHDRSFSEVANVRSSICMHEKKIVLNYTKSIKYLDLY
jgi:hypothetical protein